MKETQQTIQQIERAVRKIADKFPASQDPIMTDIHLQVKPESGELVAYDDDMEEVTRVVIDQWLEPTEENLYEAAEHVLRRCLKQMHPVIEKMAILHPFSFVLIDEENETLCDLYYVDDETIIIDGELLKGLDKELDEFLAKLLDE